MPAGVRYPSQRQTLSFASPLTRALCWAHARRKCFELADVAARLKPHNAVKGGAAVISPIAAEAVRRIDMVFDAARAVNGTTIAERLAMRQEIAMPLVTDLEQWLRSQRAAIARHNPVAGAIDYMLNDWAAFARFLGDGRICLTNCQPAGDIDPRSASNIDPAMSGLMIGLRNVGMGVRRRRA